MRKRGGSERKEDKTDPVKEESNLETNRGELVVATPLLNQKSLSSCISQGQDNGGPRNCNRVERKVFSAQYPSKHQLRPKTRELTSDSADGDPEHPSRCETA